MGKTMTATTRLTTVLAAGVLAFGAVACSSSDDSAAPASTTPSGQAGVAPSSTTEPDAGASTGAASNGGAEAGAAPTVMLDGQPVDAEFQPTRCKWETDDGHPQLEFEAGRDSSGGELEVEIVMSDPPRLDDFELETGDIEWEVTDDERRNAQITVDGDQYRVVSQVTDDDSARTAQLEVAFACAGQ